MAKNNNEEPIDRLLVKSRDEIKQLISIQIEEADAILSMEVQGQEVIDVVPFGGRR